MKETVEATDHAPKTSRRNQLPKCATNVVLAEILVSDLAFRRVLVPGIIHADRNARYLEVVCHVVDNRKPISPTVKGLTREDKTSGTTTVPA